jgi:hypothetical protein
MKKTCLAMLMVLMGLAILGCDDSKPNWDTSRRHWEIWGQGKIASITADVIDPLCPHTNKQTCGFHPVTTKYVFDNGREVSLRLIKDPGTVYAGQSGVLWKFTGYNSPDHFAWFQWIQDTDIPVDKGVAQTETKPAKKTDKKDSLITYGDIPKASYDEKKTVKRYNWKIYPDVRPARFQMVLMRLEDGTITTGHINNINEWKYETARQQDKGGITITTVAAWKELDLN